MKKLICALFVSLLLLSGCGSKTATEPEKEPIGYSEPMYIITGNNSPIEKLEDLNGKKLCIGDDYPNETQYVLDQLKEGGIEVETVKTEYYPSIYEDYNNGKFDAWLVTDDEHNMIHDYVHPYEVKDYKKIAEFKMPIYEETKVDTTIANDPLYTKPFAVMLTGIDQRVEPNEYNKALNDVNHLMIVEPQMKHVLIISFPRDSYIYGVAGGYQDKLTHLGQYGTENIKDSIGNLLDMEIPYYMQVSFSTFVDGFTKLGGVNVPVPLDMTMDQDSFRNVAQPYSLTKGYQQLYGEWGLALARNRKYGVYGGDYGRIRNQALIINSIIDKIANHPYVMKWAGLSWALKVLTYTNFTDQQVKVLLALAETFKDGYTIDNYFIENTGSMTEGGMSIGLVNDSSVAIAKGKIDLVMNKHVDENNPYIKEILTGYLTGGAGDYDTEYIGTEYDLRPLFNINIKFPDEVENNKTTEQTSETPSTEQTTDETNVEEAAQ